MASFRQMSFAGGELAPTLWGRSDLAKHAVGLKRCRNFFINRHGAATTRPGTRAIGQGKAVGGVKLVPFVYDVANGFVWVLEFGNLYVRFWRADYSVDDTFTFEEGVAGVPYELVTPYTGSEVGQLKFAQQGAVLTLCHPNHPPAELKLTNSATPTFSYSAVTFDRPAAGGSSFYLQEPLPQPLGQLWQATTTYSTGAIALFGGFYYESLIDSNVGSYPTDLTQWAPFTPADVPREWTWLVSEIWQDSRGVLFEKTPRQITESAVLFFEFWNASILYQGGGHGAGTQVTARGATFDAGSPGTVYRATADNQNEALGGADWTVDNVVTSPAPRQTDALPGTVLCSPGNPVTIILNGAYAQALTDPNFIGYRIYRGRGSVFGWVGDAKWNVATFTDAGDEPDYTQAPPQGTNPFKFYNAAGTLVSTEYPSCVTFFEGRRVFANTSERPAFIFGSAVDDYTNFDHKLVPTEDMAIQFELASRRVEDIEWLVGWQKLICGTGESVWAVGGNGGPLSFDNVDAKVQTSVGASGLDPIPVQGTLLYCRRKGVGVHALDQDVVRQSWTEEDISILAEHLFQGYSIIDWCYQQDPFQVIWAVRSDGKLLSLTYVKDHDIWAWAWHDTQGTVVAICSVPGGAEDRVYMAVERTNTSTGTQLYIERLESRITPSAASGGQLCCLDAAVYITLDPDDPQSVFTGLDRLDGTAVMALVDGAPQGPFAVTAGQITLTEPATQSIVIGLPYTPQLQMLDLAVPGGEVKAKQKNVTRVGVEIDNAVGLFAGPDFDNLKELQQRQVSDAFGSVPASSDTYLIAIPGGWTLGGGVCIQQNSPLPLTVLSVLREVEFGDT